MKKQTLSVFILLFTGLMAFAGDVSQFVDLGFSEDGKCYAFAQYGLVDNTYQAYAELQVIDVARNDYLSGGVVKIAPSKATKGRKPSAVYYELYEKNAFLLTKNRIPYKSNSNPLYMIAPLARDKNIIEFRDFENATEEYETTYLIHLSEQVSGTGKEAVSSFSLVVEQRNEDDIVLSRTNVGSNRLKRTGIVSYRVYRVFASPDGGSLAIILEQMLSNENGISIRYMAETVNLGNF